MEQVESRSTLQLYRHKIGIRDEGIYSNRYKVWIGTIIPVYNKHSEARMEATRQRLVGGAVECPICGAGEETLAHFVTECEAMDGVRRRFGVRRGDPLEEVLHLCWKNGGGGGEP